MLQCGDRVVYGIHGVCNILDVEVRTVDRKKVEYFVLSPIDQPEARFYVPTQNPAALAKLRPLLSRKELEELLHSDVVDENTWISDENQRKQRYRELITSSDRNALINMVRALHNHKAQQLAQGRKFHLCDENFLRDAEKLLTSEFSLVLEIPQNEVGKYIMNALEVSE